VRKQTELAQLEADRTQKELIASTIRPAASASWNSEYVSSVAGGEPPTIVNTISRSVIPPSTQIVGARRSCFSGGCGLARTALPFAVGPRGAAGERRPTTSPDASPGLVGGW